MNDEVLKLINFRKATKIRYYKNGNRYVIICGKKKRKFN